MSEAARRTSSATAAVLAALPANVRAEVIRGAVVAEVLSKSNAQDDLGAKLVSYHRAGAPHYWIVDPEHETWTVYRWNADAEPFAEIEVDVGMLFGG